MKVKTEIERIKETYEQRKKVISPERYSFFDPANLFIIQRREWEILKVLKKYRITSLEERRILDVGCGTGRECRNLIRYGADPQNLFGLDLLAKRVEMAKKLNPNINFTRGDASDLPYKDESFDIVMQFTVFTSILDSQMKRNIAIGMRRVLKPEGIIIWYDFHMENIKNPDVRGIKKKEIYELFAYCDIYLKRVTLAPPLARTLAPVFLFACYVLEKLRIFSTHYIGVIKKARL